jgi:CRP-like cAMP-binding protein
MNSLLIHDHFDPARVPSNLILRSLSAEEFWALRPFLVHVPFKEHSIIQEQGRRIKHVDFVESGLLSLRALAAGSAIEIGMVGHKGLSGASVVLGARFAPLQSRAITAGRLLRIRVDDLQRSINAKPGIRDRILSYVAALMIHGSQLAFCTARHSTDERLATWICIAGDALTASTIPITHEHLSTNLGLRRAGITESLSRLQSRGIIRKTRGSVQIAQRGALELAACCCCRVILDAYRR